MTFLAPTFLFGLFALPIPFLIHLWHRHRMQKMWFPSISLLRHAERGQKALRKLKDIILLVLRTLCLLFLVLAFANPSLLRKQKIAILDDSWDMLTKSGPHTLFERGRRIANSLKETKILIASGRKGSCKYQKFSLPTKGVDLIITKAGKLPHVSEVEIMELKGEETNFSIDSLYFTPSSFLAFVANHTSEERKRLVTFNSQLSTLNSLISIPPYSTSVAIFPPLSATGAGSVKIEEEDALELDNIRYFVHSPPPPLKALIIGDSAEAFFLKNALSPPQGGSNISVKISQELINPSAYDMITFIGHPPLASTKSLSIPVQAPEVEEFLTLDKISEAHPIFIGFGFIPELKQIKFTHRKLIKPQRKKAGAPINVIARFSDGTPAIYEPRSGTLAFSFPLNRKSEEFVLSPLFLPIMHRIAYWLADKPIEQHNFSVGDPVRFRVQKFKSYECRGPTQTHLLTPKIDSTGIYLYFTPEVPGIYEIPGVTKFAVNISNSLVYPSLELKAASEQVSIKKFFFLIVLVLLIAELVIRRS